MVSNAMSDLLKDGFSKRMAREYQDTLLKEVTNPIFDPEVCKWAHSRGFFAESAYAYGLDDSNVDDYVTDRDYFRIWPLNSWQRVWINDKLTLKYMLSGTEFDRYLPRYFFYTTPAGLMPLIDSGAKGTDDHFLGLLREQGEFACKPANAECSQGFNKLSYKDGVYLINNEEANAQAVLDFVKDHPNNIFTEFFRSGCGMEKISPVVHTLRVLTVNPTGADPTLAASYLRFATDVGTNDSLANYAMPDKEDVRSFNVSFDLETGAFGNGKLVYGHKIVDSPCHPDTGVEGAGILPHWTELRGMIEGLADRLNLVEYMGFDVCIAEDGPRLIEINSHSGCKYLQLFRPFLKDDFLRDYYQGKIAAIKAMADAERLRRNETVR